MGWIADLLKEVPSAAKYKADLETMERENGALRAANTALRAELERMRSSSPSSNSLLSNLSAETEAVLVFVAKHTHGSPTQIASSMELSKNVVQMHLSDLIELKHIDARYAMEREPTYYLQQHGRRYLHSRGLLE